jgi:hypothetical protein
MKLMHKKLAKIKALLAGDLSIEQVEKTPVRRTPGETTNVAHN